MKPPVKATPFLLAAMCCLLFALKCKQLPAQDRGEQSASAVLRNHYDRLYRTDARLVSGEYSQSPPLSAASGHPFWLDAAWKAGKVCMGTATFDSLLLRYDIASNELILNTTGLTVPSLQIRLNRQVVDSFTLDGRLFIPFPSKGAGEDKKFCQMLAAGKPSLLLLETKTRKVPVGGGGAAYTYQSSSSKYLYHGGNLIRYHGRRTLYRLYPQFREALQAYVGSLKPAFRGRNPDDHAALVLYCNTLIKGS